MADASVDALGIVILSFSISEVEQDSALKDVIQRWSYPLSTRQKGKPSVCLSVCLSVVD